MLHHSNALTSLVSLFVLGLIIAVTKYLSGGLERGSTHFGFVVFHGRSRAAHTLIALE